MESLASSHELPASAEPAEARDGTADAGESSGLGGLLIILSPFALAAWLAIGSAVYRVVT
jgi:hypothetical protein